MKLSFTASHVGRLALVFLLPAMPAGIARAQTEGGAIASPKSDAQDFKMPPSQDPYLQDKPAGGPDSRLSREDLRTLLHLYLRLDEPGMVEKVARRILESEPGDSETLQSLISFYLERKDAPRALNHARALVRFHPDDARAQFLLAMALNLDGQHRAATEVLVRMKSTHSPGSPFPYEGELAFAALSAGDWPQAVRSYQAMLQDPTLVPEDRHEARVQVEELYRTHLPQLGLKETFIHAQSGLIYRSQLDWSHPLSARHRLGVELERDDLKLDRAPLLRPQWANRYDALIGVTGDFPVWRAKVEGGFGDQGPIYGAGLTRVLGQDQAMTLAFHGNQRATDSLLLEILQGREDRLSLHWNARLYGDVYANLQLRGSRVLVDEETLGYGYGLELNLERVVFDGVPQFHLGYRGLINEFSQRSEDIRLVSSVAAPGTTADDRLDILEELVSPINLHGLYLSWHQTFNSKWTWRLVAGSDYSFTRSSFGQTFETGASYAATPAIDLALDAGYSTSASTSDEDSERLELILAFRCRF